MLPGGFHHRELEPSEGIPAWAKVVTVVAMLVGLVAIAGALLATGLPAKIASTAIAVVALVGGGLVWLYFSTSNRMELPAHRHERGNGSPR